MTPEIRFLPFIGILSAVLFAISNACAAPQLIVLDVVDPRNRPEDLGIYITAQRVGADIHFQVALDQTAAAMSATPSVFFDVPDRDRPRFAVSTTKLPVGRKRFTFTIPERYVKPYTSNYFPNRPMTVHCALHLPSGSIREQDKIVNFNAYRIRLDNVPTE